MWPGIGFPDINMDLIAMSGKYTRQSLKAKRLLAAACELLPVMFLTQQFRDMF